MFGFVLFAAACITRLAHLSDVPTYDELYHILAATSWVNDGTFTIEQGEYKRTPLYTIFTGWIFALVGDPDPYFARLPNVLFGALTAVVAGLWVRLVAGSFAGWIVAICLIFWPSGIHLSQIVRFYALHGLMFLFGTLATYDLFQPHRTVLRRILMAVIAVSTLWTARQLQDSTLIGVLALLLWVAVFVALPVVWRLRSRNLILGGIAALVAAGFVSGLITGAIQTAVATYMHAPWGRDPTLYHRVLSELYPLFWTLTPVLAIFALRQHPGPAWFCAVLVGTGLIAHSFAGVQNIRYIYYFSPFLFALWGMGSHALFSVLRDHLRAATAEVSGKAGTSPLVTAIMVSVGVFAFLAHDSVTHSIKLMTGRHAPPMTRGISWADALPLVRRHVADGAVVVATNDLAAAYYLDGFDVVLSNNWLPEMNEEEFARDPRTGRPLISTVQSLAEVVRTHPTGVFVASQSWWSQMSPDVPVLELISVFNSPGVNWRAERAGPVWVLSWTS